MNRLKSYITLVINLIITLYSIGQQNLVPNPSFEDTLECDFSTLFQCNDWTSSVGSADYFKSPSNCWSTGFTPNTSRGFQIPRTGNAFIGIAAYCSPSSCGSNYREIAQIKLLDTLSNDKNYCVSFYTSLSNDSEFATDDFGIYFSETQAIQMPSEFHIRNNDENYLNDSLNWNIISGIHKGLGHELYLNIGNVYYDVNTSFYVFNSASTTYSAYYFLDDVSVIELPEIDAGTNQKKLPFESVVLDGSCEGCWSGLQYTWYPAEGLNDTTVLNPIASPEVTTTYYLTLIDTSGTVPCMSEVVDSVTVTVDPGPELLIFPNPVNYGEQLQFYVGETGLENQGAYLYDAAGKLIWKQDEVQSLTKYSFDVRLATGTYSLVLRNDGKNIVQERFVVMK